MIVHERHKAVYYYMTGAVTLLLALKLLPSQFLAKIVDFSISFLPFIIVVTAIYIGITRYKNSPENLIPIQKKILRDILYLLLITLAFYIFYSPKAFLPIVETISDFGRTFSFDSYFLILSYLCIFILSISFIIFFIELYRKSIGKYKKSIATLLKRTLYPVFFIFAFLFIVSIITYPGAYSPVTSFVGNSIYSIVFQSEELDSRSSINQARVASVKSSVSKTYQNLKDSLGATNEEFVTSIIETKDNLTIAIAETKENLDNQLSDDIRDKLDLSGGTIKGDLITEDIFPDDNNTYDLGSTTKGWDNVYVHSLHGSSIITIGDSLTSHGITDSDDLLISGDLEVNGMSYFDGGANLSGSRIINLADPTDAQDAASKAYVDSLAGGSGYQSGSGTDLDMANGIITNIGNVATNFTATGGLNLADTLSVPTVSLGTNTITDGNLNGDWAGLTRLTIDNIDINGNTIAATNSSGLFLYDDGSNGIFIEDGGNIGIGTNSPNSVFDVRGGVIFNDDGGNFDFRAEGGSNQNLLFLDASTDRIGIGTNNPFTDLHVWGGTSLSGQASYLSSANLGMYTHTLASIDYVNKRDTSSVPNGHLNYIDDNNQGMGAYGVWGDGKFVYIANGINGLRTFSVDESGVITYVDTDTSPIGNCNEVWGDGKFIYVAFGSSGLRVYSVSDSGYLTFIDSDYQGGSAYGVWGDGKFIYLANDSQGLLTYSVDANGNLTYINSNNPGGNAYGVWGDGKFIYSANYDAGMHSYSVDASGNLAHIDSDDQGGQAVNMWGDGRFIYLSIRAGGTVSYSVSDSGMLTADYVNAPPRVSWDVWGDGSYLYLARFTGGVETVAVNADGSFTVIDSDSQGGAVFGIWGDDNFVYAGEWDTGLVTYSIDNAYEYSKAGGTHSFVGNVGIEDSTPTEATLTVGGDIYALTLAQVGGDPMCWDGTGGSLIGDCTSLRKYKKNIESLGIGLKELLDLTPRTFDWEDGMGHDNDIGFIAEEVAGVSPQLATYRNGELGGVKYSRMSALLVKSIQEQQEQINEISSQIEDIQEGDTNNLMAELEEQMDTLEEQSGAVMDFFLAINPGTLLYKDVKGNLDLLGGKLEAQEVETGVLTIKITDEDAPTIGEAQIQAVETDEDEDGIDDETGSDGKSVIIKTSAAHENSMIYVTPVGSTQVRIPFDIKDSEGEKIKAEIDSSQVLYVGDIDQEKSFEIKVDYPVEDDLKFNWWIVKTKQ